MAKRKRLSPPRPDLLADPLRAPESKSMFSPPSSSPAPIAQVAGDSAAAAALEEVSRELHAAREGGRMVQLLPLDAIDAGYLVRDRLAADDDEMQALMESIRARGQQVPIEVVALEAGRYGLISGWRRLTALQRLHRETGDADFARVKALLRRPENAAEAYRAMVEENEIRVGLSYYERAQVVARAAEKGVFPTEKAALKALFAAASPARRSKIGAFLALYHALDDRLKYPAAIPERLGLQLSRRLNESPDFAAKLRERLRKGRVDSAEDELAILSRALGAGPARAARKGKTGSDKARNAGNSAGGQGEEIAAGVFLETAGGYLKPRLVLSGPKVDQAFRERLIAWLKEG